MDVLKSDLRLAVRMLLRRPGFAATAVLALAIGLGINAVAFSAVNAFLFRPRAGFDIEGAGRVIVTGGLTGEEGLSPVTFDRLTAGTEGALQTAVEGRTPLAWHQNGRAETVWTLLVSAHYFSILEPKPLIGRLLTTADGAASPAAVVSERFWRERLQSADLGMLRLTLNGIDTPVVGVLPDSYEGPGGLYSPQLWLPFEARHTYQLPATLDGPEAQWLGMIGRLTNGTSIAEASARLQAAARTLARDSRSGTRISAHFSLMRERVPEVRAAAWLAAGGMAAVGLVLLIACFNVANLLLARALDRQRETGIRAAIGASQWRIVRQHVTEGLVLSALAGIAAAVVAVWSQRLVGAFAIPIPEPQRLNLSPDARVVGFIALMAIAAGVLPAIAPALQSVRLDLVGALSATGHGWRSGRLSSVRQGLMLLQIGGSTGLLAVAALFVQSFAWSGRADPGFETERAIVLTLHPASQGFAADRARLTIDRLLDRLGALPGVTHAAVATRLPLYIGFPRLTEVSGTGEPCTAGAGCTRVDTYGIGPGYFDAMKVPMAQGAEFTAASPADGVIVNAAFAERWFPNVDPLGRVLLLGAAGERRVIVGVARTTVQRGFTEQPRPALFMPMARTDYEQPIAIVLRTSVPPAPLIRAVADTLPDLDPRLAPESLMTMAERLQMPRWPMRAGSLFFGTCGVLALLLASIGLAAVMAHAVGQRTREFGIRLAIGASARQVIVDVVWSAMRVVGPGVIAGLVAAALFARAVRIALVGVDVSSPATYVLIALLQGLIALLACVVPARRAARLDPLKALRAD